MQTFLAALGPKCPSVGGIGQGQHGPEHQPIDALQPREVQLFHIVAGSVIVGMQPSVKHEHGNLPFVERVVVAVGLHLPRRRAAPIAGYWHPAIKLGDKIKPGDRLGTVRDLVGKDVRTITAEREGMVLYHSTSLAISAGEALVGIAV